MGVRSWELGVRGFAAICLLALLTGSVCAFPITSYVTQMDIQPDSSVNVTDTITADFTGEPHHGIWREIPLSGKDRWGSNVRIRLENLSITDDSGADIPFERSWRSGRLRLKIGSANVTIDRPQTYVIKYKLWRAVHFFQTWDELYWNAVGHEWEVPIERATAIVTIPKAAKSGELRIQSYTGSYGNTTSEASGLTEGDRIARFTMSRPLQPGEGMTIVVGWPKGIVTPPTFGQEAMWFILDNGYFLVVPLFLVGLLILWMRAGADPDTGRSEVVAYDPPDNLNPAELGTLIDERVDMRDISASIVDLAVKGFMTIRQSSQSGFFGPDVDYTLELTRSYEETTSDPNLSEFERALVQGIFGGARSRTISSLKNNFYVHLPKLKNALYNSMILHRYFTQSPESIRNSYRGGGVALMIAGVFAAIFSQAQGSPLTIPLGYGIAIIICGAILAAFARLMPRKTTTGKNALLAARGFEEYLSRAEREMIEHQERQNYFEKFLPYAMAFGIADKWARAFEGIQTTPPDWYSGGEGTFRPTIFAHDISYAAHSWGQSFASTPRTSGGGGSSFFGGGSGFGGGFSGGGGGGGGGGGW